MREIINISLPKELNKEIERIIKKERYSTKSEFLRELIREKIAEEDLLARIKKSREEIQSGEGKALKSLRNLR